jgi:hypothetical protein
MAMRFKSEAELATWLRQRKASAGNVVDTPQEKATITPIGLPVGDVPSSSRRRETRVGDGVLYFVAVVTCLAMLIAGASSLLWAYAFLLAARGGKP